MKSLYNRGAYKSNINYMMYGYGYDYGFFHILNAVFWIAVIFLAIGWFRRNRAARHGHSCFSWPNKALETLKERFAKGEINKEEYEERKKVLME